MYAQIRTKLLTSSLSAGRVNLRDLRHTPPAPPCTLDTRYGLRTAMTGSFPPSLNSQSIHCHPQAVSHAI